MGASVWPSPHPRIHIRLLTATFSTVSIIPHDFGRLRERTELKANESAGKHRLGDFPPFPHSPIRGIPTIHMFGLHQRLRS